MKIFALASLPTVVLSMAAGVMLSVNPVDTAQARIDPGCDQRTYLPAAMEFVKDDHLEKAGGGHGKNGGTLWYAVNGKYCRNAYRIAAGSGQLNATNDCKTNVGSIPDTSGVTLRYIANKSWGSKTVRGPVWRVGDVKCRTGKKRTALFVHSNGKVGTKWPHDHEHNSKKYWWANYYQTNGCIKANQRDRGEMAERWAKYAKNAGNPTIKVRTP